MDMPDFHPNLEDYGCYGDCVDQYYDAVCRVAYRTMIQHVMREFPDGHVCGDDRSRLMEISVDVIDKAHMGADEVFDVADFWAEMEGIPMSRATEFAFQEYGEAVQEGVVHAQHRLFRETDPGTYRAIVRVTTDSLQLVRLEPQPLW